MEKLLSAFIRPIQHRTYSTEIPRTGEQQRARTATSRFFAHQALILYTIKLRLAIQFQDFFL